MLYSDSALLPWVPAPALPCPACEERSLLSFFCRLYFSFPFSLLIFEAWTVSCLHDAIIWRNQDHLLSRSCARVLSNHYLEFGEEFCLVLLLVSVEELKQSLVATTLELEVAKEELKKKEQSIAKLADLVRQVAKERDDARDQLQHLLLAASKPAPTPQPPALVTSSVTDSDCSLVSSPVDPFFDPVTSSDNRCKLSSPPPAKQSAIASADAVLDMLANKKPLPQRGRLVQSVMEAGPLLQNLLVAGLLPRWRNPPTVHSLDTLPVGVRGVGGGYVGTSLPGANAAAVRGYGGGSACMKRPMAATSTNATNCKPGFGAKRHRLH